ncbi:MAG: glutamine-synthetase adenylyltransferase, partial [Acetobacteraceae bacterium]
MERFIELGRPEARLAAQAGPRALLHCLGGNSPYLAELTLREPVAFRRLVTDGPDAVAQAAMNDLIAISPAAGREKVVAGMRRAKRIVALTTAIADIGGLWPLETVTGALSALAEAALSLSVAHLMRSAHDAGEIRLTDPENPNPGCGFTVLGMGKLGARELNFSSDVDLVLLYDPDSPVYTGRSAGDAIGGFTTRVARGLVTLMEARDADGYVFRTDLRLRPDPAATPPAIAIGAALTYYESMGQNWERAAMIKARPVAGDLALGTEFLDAIRPFVWRRGLDFAAVADIHAMKRKIDQHKGTALGATRNPTARIAGHNVKLGEGGIREIEFLVQTLQLVWGGRDPAMRVPTTIGALRLLTRAGRVPQEAEPELEAAYAFLRRVEHRIQMVNDRQTHTLPEKPADLERIALFLGYPDAAAFAVALLDQLARVRARYAQVFEAVPDLPDGAAAGPMLDFRGDGPPPDDTQAALRALGFEAIDRIVSTVRRWQAGHVRALRSMRARDLMTTMLPLILARLAAQPQPDETFNRFDRFLAAQPAGVQLLSLFQRNPTLLDRIAAVLGAAPQLAEHLARHPSALEGLLIEEEADAALVRLTAQ